MRQFGGRVPVLALVLVLGLAVPLSAQPVARRVAPERTSSPWLPAISRTDLVSVRVAQVGPDAARRMPRWVKWGFVGAAAGAVTLPLLSSLASDTESNTARAAAAGALGGFVIIGGSVALWDAVCAGDTSSRRAGLCGRR